MKNLPISKGTKFTLVDDEDFKYLSGFTWRTDRKGYVVRTVNINTGKKSEQRQKTLMLHYAILPVKEGFMVDHANRNPLDNRKENLRYCTNSQNQANRIYTNKTGFRGVKKDGNKFVAFCTKDKIRWGSLPFDTAAEAAVAYNSLAKTLHGEFAILNEV